jgi:hypothetical protein
MCLLFNKIGKRPEYVLPGSKGSGEVGGQEGGGSRERWLKHYMQI